MSHERVTWRGAAAYHGAYWAALLGRRVVVIPFGSSKFGTLPFRHTLVGSLAEATACEPERNVGYLTAARSQNRVFADQVAELLDLNSVGGPP